MVNKIKPKLKYSPSDEEIEVPRIEFDLDSTPKEKSKEIVHKKNERKERGRKPDNTRLF